jgi:transcriptional regulator with XRE-family HTH domain
MMAQPLEDVKEIGQRVRNARYVAGLSQRALAQRSGVTKESLSRIENGRSKKPPYPTTLTKLAKALNVPVETFTER